MTEQLLLLSKQILSQPVPNYRRFLDSIIDYRDRLIGILGARGTGKTTLLLQHLKKDVIGDDAMYLIADHPLVLERGLFQIADDFQKMGGRLLVIDEIHKYENFERELKLIYDSFFQLQVIFTGSSAVAIEHAKADLSRRAMIYRLPVLSFREFLEIESAESFPVLTLQEILQNHSRIATEILMKLKPLPYFRKYLELGAYPFYFDNPDTYLPKLLNATLQVLETDLPMIYHIDPEKINALKKMMTMLCRSEPYDINVSKLCGALGLNRRTLYKYLGILQAAGLLHILGAKSSGVSLISKPEKLYLNNPNLFSIFCEEAKTGTIRETFFASQLSYRHRLDYPKSGDFVVDERVVFEVGGKEKTGKQIQQFESAYVVADNIEVGAAKRIPLWIFGFLY